MKTRIHFKARFYIIILISLSNLYSVHAQHEYPKDFFRSPIDSTLRLAGNFGEIRPNHFHAGLDIKTDNKEGMKLYAIADGYVSRIKISPLGYGKSLYITHPNGYVSVYAHLQSYNKAIGKYVKNAQYALESFEIELFPTVNELPVKKGEILALSGNTGSSSGPHLHFEIRDEKTEHALNPLLFGLNVKDIIKPVITGLYLYCFNDSIYQESVCDKNTLPQKIAITGTNGNYKLKTPGVLKIPPNTGFGIDVFDQQNGSSNKNGIYSIELKMDNERIYYQKMDRIAFDESRYINSHIDYYEQKAKDKSIQKSFLAHNNQLKIYKDVKDMGIIYLKDSAVHKMQYLVKDIAGNTSTLSFDVRRNFKKEKPLYPVSCVAVFNCKKDNQFKKEDLLIDFPPNTFYEDLKFDYSVSKDSIRGALAPLHHIHNRYVPVHSYYTLSIKSKQIPSSVQSKALIVSIDEKGKKYYEGGEWIDGYVTTKTRSFGNFTIVIDTTPPLITPLNISPFKNMNTLKTIQIRVNDNLSGIGSYRATIDGKWILMEYELKKNLLFYTFDESFAKGKHTFNIEVKDNRNNVSIYQADFFR